MQPVNSLPPEIISHVVRYIPDEDSENDASSIIPMTHVCRYWRDSITSTPENWTRISSKRIGIAKLSLDRCKAAPLDLWLDVGCDGITPGFSDLITPYIQNTKALTISSFFSQEQFFQTLEVFLPLTPNLQSLTLVGGTEGDSLDYPNDPCGQPLSSLTSLFLDRVSLCPTFLRLRTLKDFTILHPKFNNHLGTLLDFLEQNRSLERADIDVEFTQDSLLDLQHRAPIENRLRNLTISAHSVVDLKAFISKIVVQKGAHLELNLFDYNMGQGDASSVLSDVHRLNPRSYTSMEYRPRKKLKIIQLLGPDGSFSFERWTAEAPFAEFSRFPLNNVQTFHLKHKSPDFGKPPPVPAIIPPSLFPALETLVVENETAASLLLSAFFSNPSSSRSLKTLAFFNCYIDDGFMKELTQFSSNRKKATLAPLNRVVIVVNPSKNPRNPLPSTDELGKYVPVVDVHVGGELPSDLRWNGRVE